MGALMLPTSQSTDRGVMPWCPWEVVRSRAYCEEWITGHMPLGLFSPALLLGHHEVNGLFNFEFLQS